MDKIDLEDLNIPREGIIHLSIFWRIVLFPTIFIWWFLLQLIIFTMIAGPIVMFIAFINMVASFGSIHWKMDIITDFQFFIMPIVAPFIWLYKYFRLGEFNTLLEE